MIDMHAHWRPAELADALRARSREPRIVRNPGGVEVLKLQRMSEEPLANAFDHVDFHLDRMDRQAVRISVLSLLGSFCWIESQPPEVAVPLCRTVNDRLSAICQEHPGRFAAYAAVPLTDLPAAAERPGCRASSAHSFLATPSSRATKPKRCVHCWKSRTAATPCSSSTMAPDRAMRSPRWPATRTTRAGVTARSTCRRACPR